MQQHDNATTPVVEDEGFDFKKIFSYALAYWKLIVFSVIVCMAAAFVYLRFAVPGYRVTAKILLQDKSKGSFTSSADMLADFGFQTQNTSVENEIEVIKSMSVVRGAVAKSGLNVSYAVPGVTNWPIYKEKSPVKVSYGADVDGVTSIDSLANLHTPVRMRFVFDKDGNAALEYSCFVNPSSSEPKEFKTKVDSYPYILNTPVGNLLIEKNEAVPCAGGELLVTVNPLESVALSLMSALSIAPVSRNSSVAVLAINTPLPGNGIDFLNAVIENYNYVTNEDKRQVARQTEAFIIERIDSLSKELVIMETRLSNYKKKNQLIDPKLDAPQVSSNKTEYTKQVEQIDLMLKSSKFLKDFVHDSKNDMKVIPTTFGLTIDQSLVALISNYNKEVIDYSQLQLSASGDNPLLKSAAVRVQQLQADLRIAIDAFDRSLHLQREAIATLLAGYTSRYEQSPDIERELVTIERECAIKSELYVMLLQKYEENALSLAVTSNNLRCIDSPLLVGRVSPNKKMIFLAALFIALVIPAVIIYIRESMRTQLTINDDIATLTALPCVGNIPVKHSVKERNQAVVVARNKNDIMAEAFRTLRTNLQFVMKKSTGKVVMFTSTTSGEGKTFVASNLAMSVALLGKKVLLMGLDIRRPRLAEMFGFDKNAEGITSYLAANEKDTYILDDAIRPSGIEDNLDILAAGIVPPNPAELLARSNMDKAIEYLSTKYDFIVMDTAPVGLVTDSMIISRVADAVVYVARVDYTKKADFGYLNSIVADGKLENVSLVINGEDTKKKMYGYVSSRKGSNRYVGYGGYGYGGYVSDDEEKGKK